MVRHTIGNSHIILHVSFFVTSICVLINFLCNIGERLGYTFHSSLPHTCYLIYMSLCHIHSVPLLSRLQPYCMGWRPRICHRLGHKTLGSGSGIGQESPLTWECGILESRVVETDRITHALIKMTRVCMITQVHPPGIFYVRPLPATCCAESCQSPTVIITDLRLTPANVASRELMSY